MTYLQTAFLYKKVVVVQCGMLYSVVCCTVIQCGMLYSVGCCCTLVVQCHMLYSCCTVWFVCRGLHFTPWQTSALKHLRRADYTLTKTVGLSISQWLPCPVAIWAFALDGNLVKSVTCYSLLYAGPVSTGILHFVPCSSWSC